MIRKCVAFLRELNSAQTSRCGYTFGTDVVLDALEKRVAHKFCPWLRFGLHKFEMGDSTTEARGRSWRLVLAPWFEEQRAALRSFGNDESSALLFALRTDGGKLEVFVTCKENRRVSWLSKNVTKGEWTSAAAPKTKEERLNLLAQYHEVCDRSTNWQPKSVQSTHCGAHVPALVASTAPPPISSPPFNAVVMASELWDVLQGDVKVDRAEAAHQDGVPGLYAIRDKDGRSQTPFAMGILTIKSVRDRLARITWDVGSEGLHGRTTYVSIDNVVLPPAQPASRVCSKCGGEVGLTARQCSCGHRVVAPKLDEDPQRLSLQLYGNLTTDANVLKELSVPRSDGLQLTKEEQEEAGGLFNEIYLPQALTQEGGAIYATNFKAPFERENQRAQADIEWRKAIAAASQNHCPDSAVMAQSQTHGATAISLARKVIAKARAAQAQGVNQIEVASLSLTGTPAYEGLLECAYPSAAIEHCLSHNLDVTTDVVPAHVGVAAAASLDVSRCKVLPKEASITVHAEMLPGAQPIMVEPLPAALAASAHKIADFIKRTGASAALGTVCQHGPARLTERSIMFGVCSGQKSQPPYSNSTGNYGVPGKSGKEDLAFERKVALRKELQVLINAHGLLAAAEIRRAQPEIYAKMARLRELLGRHPVYSEAAAAAEGNISFANPIFTNGYVSVGARATHRHTDYRNPHLTHLTTMQLGCWGDALLTGQTVLFNRFGTECVVIEDRPGGRQIMGGLNAISHGNMIPD